MRVLLAIIILLFSTLPCDAAFKSSSEAVPTEEDTWNPHSLKDDIILPMPCGLSLAMRGVGIPSGSLLRDQGFTMGIRKALDKNREIYENRFEGYIAAPFTLKNLPAAWQNRLKGSQDAKDALYFIGKYEISRQQWLAVMNALDKDGVENPEQCPKLEKNSNLPVTEISWFDAQEFLNKYNAWLVREHLEELPSFKPGKEVAFFRLPTEEEWEYAARAYPKVPQEWWEENDTFRPEEGTTLDDYAVTSKLTTLSNPQKIGSRHANPLGIYDTAGNVSEMVDGFFRMLKKDSANGQGVGRLHGASGGILIKGGSFRSNEDYQTLPGARDEIPIYSAAGTNKRSDVGFRVALAAVNVPNGDRLKVLREEAANQISMQEKKSRIKGDTPLAMVESMARQAQGADKQALDRLHSLLQDQQAMYKSQELKNLEQSFRSLLYEMETLRAFGFRYAQANGLVQKLKALRPQAKTPKDEKELRDAIAAGESDLKSYQESLRMGANHFKSMLESICAFPEEETAQLFRKVQKEYGSGSIFDTHMQQNLQTFAETEEQLRKKGSSALNQKSILKSILPDSHFKQIRF